MDKCVCHLNGYAIKDAQARQKIAELEGKATELQEIDSTLRNDVDSLLSSDTNVDARITEIETDVANNTSKLSTLETQVGTNAEGVGNNERRIETIEGQISNLSTADENNSTAISELETSFETYKKTSNIIYRFYRPSGPVAVIVNQYIPMETYITNDTNSLLSLDSDGKIVIGEGVHHIKLWGYLAGNFYEATLAQGRVWFEIPGGMKGVTNGEYRGLNYSFSSISIPEQFFIVEAGTKITMGIGSTNSSTGTFNACEGFGEFGCDIHIEIID